jgi:GST-like protein
MLRLYTWKTPNGYKPAILLEELEEAYELVPIDLNRGEQKDPKYLDINPNGKIPALIDEDAEGGPLTVFESGAVLMYLAEKAGKFFPEDTRHRYEVMEWLMFQMGGIGPMFGQASHFISHAPEKIDYAVKRYTEEANRLTSVLEKRLGDAEYLAGEYSIADIATWPWMRAGVSIGAVNLEEYPQTERWFKTIERRSAVSRALEKVDKAAAGAPAVCEITPG